MTNETRADLANLWMMIAEKKKNAESPSGKAVAEMCEESYKRIAALLNRASISGFQVRFSGPPGHRAGRFIEVEDLEGNGMNLGTWVQERNKKSWVLKFTE